MALYVSGVGSREKKREKRKKGGEKSSIDIGNREIFGAGWRHLSAVGAL